MTHFYDVLIVGAGHGGAQTAMALRQRKFGGTIAILGEEPDLPYERPPLTKEYLAGAKAFDRLLIRPVKFWDDRHITILTQCRVVSVDALVQTVTTEAGDIFGYGELIWATGGRARMLNCEGHDLSGVHSIRNRADVDRMTADLASVARIVVIGGGYIGLEAAAVLATLGKTVIVLETQDRILSRVAGVALSRFYEAEHRARGVDIRLNQNIRCISGQDGHVTGVLLQTGEFLPAEMLIVGIGIIPIVQPLLAAGAVGGNGVMVDEYCQTSLPHVFAVGDCAAHINRYADNVVVRLESIQNANDMATTVAAVITGDPKSYDSVPWFWSNQYDLKLQTIGISTGHDNAIVRGDPTSRSFSVIYLSKGRVLALDCVNRAKDFVQGKLLITSKDFIIDDAICDSQISLKDLLLSTL